MTRGPDDERRSLCPVCNGSGEQGPFQWCPRCDGVGFLDDDKDAAARARVLADDLEER